MNVAITVASTLAEPWISLRHLGQERTWLATCELPVFHIVGRPLGPVGSAIDSLHERSRQHLIGRFAQRGLSRATIAHRRQPPRTLRTHEGFFVDLPDTWFNGGWKTIALMEAMLSENGWDFLYATTNGCYVNPWALERTLEDLPRQGTYAGTLYRDKRESWLSGYSIILSRDVAEMILANSSKWDHSVHNDLALGRLMRRVGVQPIELPHRWLTHPADVDSLSTGNLQEIYNFRCKVISDRKVDVEIMRALHVRVLRAEGWDGLT